MDSPCLFPLLLLQKPMSTVVWLLHHFTCFFLPVPLFWNILQDCKEATYYEKKKPIILVILKSWILSQFTEQWGHWRISHIFQNLFLFYFQVGGDNVQVYRYNLGQSYQAPGIHSCSGQPGRRGRCYVRLRKHCQATYQTPRGIQIALIIHQSQRSLPNRTRLWNSICCCSYQYRAYKCWSKGHPGVWCSEKGKNLDVVVKDSS